MAEYKNLIRSFQNYISRKAISKNASKKNDFLSLEIDKLYAKIEANDLVLPICHIGIISRQKDRFYLYADFNC